MSKTEINLFLFFLGRTVIESTITETTFGAIAPVPNDDDDDDEREVIGRILGSGNRSTRSKHVTVPLRLPQIPQILTRYRTQAA
jgi:hypothetical protein